MTDEEDRFIGFFSEIHEKFCHDTYLRDTPRTSLDALTREDRYRVDDDDTSWMEDEGREDIIEVRLSDEGDILTRDSETLRSHRDLPDMFLSRNIEYSFSLTRIPLTHLERKCRLPDPRLSREEDETPWRDPSPEDTIEFPTRTRYFFEDMIRSHLDFPDFDMFPRDRFSFLRVDFRLFECVPLTTARTLPDPFRSTHMTG